ncbi:MAG: hypothetical protein QOG49_751, partial [Frankiaceae bacterium]|nr:hypothetical protein [Frankiaceae bacterium]
LAQRGRVELQADNVDGARDLLAVGDERVIRRDVEMEVGPPVRRTPLRRHDGRGPAPAELPPPGRRSGRDHGAGWTVGHFVPSSRSLRALALRVAGWRLRIVTAARTSAKTSILATVMLRGPDEEPRWTYGSPFSARRP